jgi:hypothetical protein
MGLWLAWDAMSRATLGQVHTTGIERATGRLMRLVSLRRHRQQSPAPKRETPTCFLHFSAICKTTAHENDA